MNVQISVPPAATTKASATTFPALPQRPKTSTKRSRSLPIHLQETIPKMKDSKRLFWFLPPTSTLSTRSSPASTPTQKRRKKKQSGAILTRYGRTGGSTTVATLPSIALPHELDLPPLYHAVTPTRRGSTLADEIHDDDTIHENSNSNSNNYVRKKHLTDGSLCIPSLQSKELRNKMTKHHETPPLLGLAWDDIVLESLYDSDDDDESLVGVDFVVH